MIIIRYSLFIVDIVIITEICVTTLFWFHGGFNFWHSEHVWHANAHKWLVKSKTMPINMMNSIHTQSCVSCWFSSVFDNAWNYIRRIQLTNVRKCDLITVMQWNTPHSPRIGCKQRIHLNLNVIWNYNFIYIESLGCNMKTISNRFIKCSLPWQRCSRSLNQTKAMNENLSNLTTQWKLIHQLISH